MKEKQFLAALKRLDALMDAVPGTPEGEELERLSDEVEAYEAIHYPIGPPTPEAARAFREDQEGGKE